MHDFAVFVSQKWAYWGDFNTNEQKKLQKQKARCSGPFLFLDRLKVFLRRNAKTNTCVAKNKANTASHVKAFGKKNVLKTFCADKELIELERKQMMTMTDCFIQRTLFLFYPYV